MCLYYIKLFQVRRSAHSYLTLSQTRKLAFQLNSSIHPQKTMHVRVSHSSSRMYIRFQTLLSYPENFIEAFDLQRPHHITGPSLMTSVHARIFPSETVGNPHSSFPVLKLFRNAYILLLIVFLWPLESHHQRQRPKWLLLTWEHFFVCFFLSSSSGTEHKQVLSPQPRLSYFMLSSLPRFTLPGLLLFSVFSYPHP